MSDFGDAFKYAEAISHHGARKDGAGDYTSVPANRLAAVTQRCVDLEIALKDLLEICKREYGESMIEGEVLLKQRIIDIRRKLKEPGSLLAEREEAVRGQTTADILQAVHQVDCGCPWLTVNDPDHRSVTNLPDCAHRESKKNCLTAIRGAATIKALLKDP